MGCGLFEGGDLRLLPRFIPTECLRKFAGNLRCLLQRGASVEEEQARATGQHVLDGAGHLVACKPSRIVVVAPGIVDRQVARDAPPFDEAPEHGCVIDGVFGHVAIRRPLSAGDREQARRRNLDVVIA